MNNVTTKTRTYSYSLPQFDPSFAMAHTGLEYMLALVAGKTGSEPSIAATLGMSAPYNLEFGKVCMDAEPSDFLMNPLGTVHGGFAATLLDSVTAIAVHTTLPKGMGYTTSDLNVKMTRAIFPSVGKLRAEGRVIHQGRQMATSEGRLIGIDDGKLYAHAQATCFIFSLEKMLS